MRKLEVVQGAKRSTATNCENGAPATVLELVSRIDRLLDAPVIDLSLIATEIRSQSVLEALIVRLVNSLSLRPEGSAQDLDSAISVMGPDRLRVVLYAWTLLEKKSREQQNRNGAEESLEGVLGEFPAIPWAAFAQLNGAPQRNVLVRARPRTRRIRRFTRDAHARLPRAHTDPRSSPPSSGADRTCLIEFRRE